MAGDYQALTDRQQQMLDVIDRGEAAWRAGDMGALMALFTPDAVLTSPTGDNYGVSSLAGSSALPDTTLLEPIVFNGNVATVVERYSLGTDPITEVFEFTTTGDVLITHDTAFDAAVPPTP